MKKLMLFAVCAMAVMMGCKNKDKVKSAEGMADSATVAVIDSIIEENDTTPLPMFLIGDDGKYMQMLYWSNFEEPVKTGDDDEWVEMAHRSWERQEMFRRNAAQYTNLLTENGSVKVKFIDEVLKDPDGDTPSIGEIHGRKEIPSLCARFDYVNPKDRVDESWGLVIVTDSYLNTRRRLAVKSCQDSEYNYPNLPADIVKQLETKYGMEVQASHKTCTIGDHYIMGAIEFKGEYKDALKLPYDPDRKYALALEILVDSGKVYVLEQLGYYDEEYGNSWNADADGYIPNTIVAAFEGPKGLELCYTHGAPESFCTGMLFPRERLRVGDGMSGMGKLIEMEYEGYHAIVDEEIPVWKKDLEVMDKIYHADELGDKDVELTKWAHCFIDFDNEWIWLRDKDDKNGAFFIRKDGKFKLIAVENTRRQPSKAEKDGAYYLKLTGSAGGPSWQQEIHVFKNGKQIEKFNVLQVYGEVSECELNGKDISVEEGKAYLNKVPEGKKIDAWFKDINSKDN